MLIARYVQTKRLEDCLLTTRKSPRNAFIPISILNCYTLVLGPVHDKTQQPVKFNTYVNLQQNLKAKDCFHTMLHNEQEADIRMN